MEDVTNLVDGEKQANEDVEDNHVHEGGKSQKSSFHRVGKEESMEQTEERFVWLETHKT